MPEKEFVLKETGFEICEWGPEDGFICEKCGTENVQLYFQGPTDAGRYYCYDCIFDEYVANAEFDEQMMDGVK